MKKIYTLAMLMTIAFANVKAQQLLLTWGDNQYGRLGNGSSTSKNAPDLIGTGSWLKVSAGDFFSAGILSDGSLWTWGDKSEGQLGEGSIVGTATGEEAPLMIGSDQDWKDLSAGSRFTLAIKTDGTLWGWGDNGEYVLGTGSTTDIYVPAKIGTETNWKSVAAGDAHVLALKTEGTLWAWGDNDFGKLGIGSTIVSPLPKQVGSSADWKMAVAGRECSFAIKADGTLWAWGQSTTGGTNMNVPVQLGTDADWKLITSRNNSHFAIKADGSLWAWGNNFVGQLGIGSTTTPITPTQVGSDKNWESVANGYMHAVALKTDHTIWGMGAGNASGVLAPLGSNTPVQIGSSDSWVSVASGNSHMLGLGRTGGTVINEATKNTCCIVYPNPAADFIYITVPLPINIKILSVTGKIVYSGASTEVNVATYAPGIYFYTISLKNGSVASGKFYKQ